MANFDLIDPLDYGTISHMARLDGALLDAIGWNGAIGSNEGIGSFMNYFKHGRNWQCKLCTTMH